MEKLAVMGTNLNPSEQAVYPEVVAFAKSMIAGVPPAVKETPEGKRMLKVSQMIFDQPHIAPEALAAIKGTNTGNEGRSRPHPRRTHSGHLSPPPQCPALHLP
jgi:hypothetical protein